MSLIKAILLFALFAKSSAFNVVSTMYSDTTGAAGVKLNAYPARVRLGNRSVKVFPIALYSDRIRTYKYKIIKLRNRKNGRVAYGHVIDECATGDCHENRAYAKKRNAVLVDVHKTMWRALGLSSYGRHMLDGSVQSSKRYSYKNSPEIRRVTTDEGRHGYVPQQWKI